MDNTRLLREILNRNTQTLLECNDNVALMKHAVDELYRIYSQITGVKADQFNLYKDVMLPTGKAISTAAAAHCLLEMKRTALFLRGINKAIKQKLSKTPDRPIRILYAGTGPYGTLLIPLLSFFKSTDLQVDVLDINRDSLIALLGLIDMLALDAYLDDVYCTDATTFKVEKPYDIVISETMLACLKSEPQVAIMQNLIPQLKESCIFIPEEITIDACLTNPKMEMDRLLYTETGQPAFERHLLGNVFTVSKQNLDSVLSCKIFPIPRITASFPVLKLFTSVRVFADELLTENDSSITLPKQYYDFRTQEADQVEFWYEQGEKPQIRSRMVEYKRISRTVGVEF